MTTCPHKDSRCTRICVNGFIEDALRFRRLTELIDAELISPDSMHWLTIEELRVVIDRFRKVNAK